MAVRDYTLDDYDEFLAAEGRKPGRVERMPGIDEFHGYGGYSAVPRARRMIAALTPAERLNGERLEPERLAEVAAAARVADWEVERLLDEFAACRDCYRKVSDLGWWAKLMLILGWGRIKD